MDLLTHFLSNFKGDFLQTKTFVYLLLYTRHGRHYKMFKPMNVQYYSLFMAWFYKYFKKKTSFFDDL